MKKFLKGDDGAVTYRNVEIEFIRGKKATMSIMEDGEEIENIALSDYDEEGEEAMHDLFKQKGFERMSPEEIQPMIEAHAEEKRKEEEERAKRHLERKEATLNNYRGGFEQAGHRANEL